MFARDFATINPYLYHLTDKGNAEDILSRRQVLSTTEIAAAAFQNTEARQEFLRARRPEHVILEADGKRYSIRDQRPISVTVLERSLTSGWNAANFIEHLNRRVFFWPTIERLRRHYERYSRESPVIIRVESEAMLNLNTHVELARLNTGATRCHPAYGGDAPTRGEGTFQPPQEIQYGLRSIAEVTFPGSCALPQNVCIGATPDGVWRCA